MSKISLTPNASGTGTFTIESPNSNTNRTLTLPDADGALLTDPLKYTTVTGTTPSLDIGSYNFFNNGAVTEDTTVSFSNVPTEAHWRYSYEKSGTVIPWEFNTLTANGELNITAEEPSPKGMFIKPDGTELYTTGNSDEVNQYTLSTPWDITTASFTRLLGIAGREASPTDLFFDPSGVYMYIVGNNGVEVNQFTMSTPWNIATAAYTRVFSVSAQDSSPQSLWFKPDGTVMYVGGGAGADLNEYSLSTAWNISTASFQQTHNLFAYGIFFKSDGTKLYQVTGSLLEYTLSTAWDLTTATLTKTTVSGGGNDGFIKPDGLVVYVLNDATNLITQYDNGVEEATVTLPASIENPPTTVLALGDRATYEFLTDDGGTTITLISEEIS